MSIKVDLTVKLYAPDDDAADKVMRALIDAGNDNNVAVFMSETAREKE